MSYSKNPHLYPAWMKAAVEYYESTESINKMVVPFSSTREAQAMRFRLYAYVKLVGARGIKRAQIRVENASLVIEPYLDSDSDRRAAEAVLTQMTLPRMTPGLPLNDSQPPPNFHYNGGQATTPPPPTGIKLNSEVIRSMQEEGDQQLMAMGFGPQKSEDTK